MRKLIIGAAALLAVALPSIAAADTGGSIQLTYASISDDLADSKDNVVALSGVVITDLQASGWRLQANATNSDADAYNNSFAYSQGELHAVYDMGNVQIGGFAGMLNANGFNYYEYGVEAAMNFSRGQVAISAAGASSPNSNLDSVTSVAVSGALMVTENLSVGATVSTTDYGNYGSSDSVDSYGVNVAYEVPNTDVTLGVGYRSSDFDNNTVDFIGVSVAWGFGDGARGRRMPGAAALIPDAIAIE